MPKEKEAKQGHRLFVLAKLAGDANTVCTVKLTVKETDGEYSAEVENIYRAYDAKVEIKTPDVKRELNTPEEYRARNTAGV